MLFLDSVYINQNKGLTLPGMDITIHEMLACTNFSAVSLGKICEATLRGSRPTSAKNTHH